MLTATYSLVTLTAEQHNARKILSKLQVQIHDILLDLQSLNQATVENALRKLEQFEDYCHSRKVELYLIPAIRKTTHKADPILAELEFLSSHGMQLLRSLHEQMRHAMGQGMAGIKRIYSTVEMYFHNLAKRLAKEEEELLPLVRNLLPREEWFDIAAKFLSDDAKSREKIHVAVKQDQTT